MERYKEALLAAAFRDGFGIENAVSSGIPTLRTTDIGDWGRLCPQDPPQVNVGHQERSKWAFQDGDLMVTRTGATIGKCAVYEARFGPRIAKRLSHTVRLDMQVAVSRFVLLFLLSPKGQQQLLEGRTAVAQPNINANAILSVELPLPPVELQKSIVCRIGTAFAWLDRVAAEHANASRLLPKLDQAILAKAFRGELVSLDTAIT
jgi:type I restriction enzyme, S subunit